MELRASSGLLTAAFVSLMVCLALPQHAHAGFGRSGGSHGSHGGGGRSHSGGSHSVSRGSSGGFGRSSSVTSGSGYYGSRRYYGSRYRDHAGSFRSGGYVPQRSWGWGGGYGYPVYPRSWGYPVWGYGFGYVSPYSQPGVIVDGQPSAAEPYSTDSAVAVAVAGEVMASSAGPLLGAQLSVEGETLGFVLGYTAAFPPIGGTNEADTLHLAIAHMTFALWASERGRLRGEVGVHLAAAPLATFVAPGAGLSAAFGIVGPLGIEARVYGNAWPYTQVDARAGLALSFGGVGLGAGIRALYLNDNGALGDVNAGSTSDIFWGPYATLAVAL